MSIEALKEQARRHEQKEKWDKALDLYMQAIQKLEANENTDVSLYNRAGDLNTRIGDSNGALDCYNKAIDLYLDQELPNNAIAVCKKIIRNVPEDAGSFLRMGQIRADQGFMVDARANYISYAEKVDPEEALRALEEFADKASDDHEIRMLLAAQMEQMERPSDAAQQLVKAFHTMNAKGMTDEASALEAKISDLDPNAFDVVPEPVAVAADGDDADAGDFGLEDADFGADLGDIELGGDEDAADEPAAAEVGGDFGEFEIGGDDEAEGDEAELPMMAFDEGGADEASEAIEEGFEDAAAELEAAAAELASFDSEIEEVEVGGLEMSLDDEEEAEEDAEELPMMSFDDSDDDGPEVAGDFGEIDLADDEGAEDLPTMSIDADDDMSMDIAGAFDDAEEGEAEEAMEAAVEEEAAAGGEEWRDLAEAGDHGGAIEALDQVIAESPDDPELRERRVELAFQINDPSVLSASYFGLATALEATGEATRAQAVYQQAVQADSENEDAKAALARLEGDEGGAEEAAVASSDDYVDLGGMILDSGPKEKSTRFVVAYEEPSGDEQADFAKMLAQFKEKVSENVDADDVTAHYDLGTAYKEMGLLDEAIQQYQQALRASVNHLPTYEMLGQTFLEKGQHDAAVRSLTRALDADYEVEDELMGIYYYLGRAHQELGNNDEAIEFYDRVFSLDINFADVTERLRELRP